VSAPAPLAVVLVVGLTPDLLRHAPRLGALARDGFMATLDPAIPAVTCTAQATLLTGCLPREHGIVANGWYFRDLGEVWLWRQSNRLVQGEKVWETARRARPSLRVAKLFWWYNMYSSADVSVTPRPIYPADGRKIPGLYSQPPELGRRLQQELGDFPLFDFWGPRAGIRSSEWIARAARRVFDGERPDLLLVYLPHLDYDLQRFGPFDARIPGAVAAVDRVAGELVEHLRAAGAEVVALSEYGIEAATGAVLPNRALREAGLLAVQETLSWELLDAGASRAFAVADHQIAHVYVRDPADVARTAALLGRLDGVERVLDRDAQRSLGLDHERSGELVLLAAPGRWFAYYYWLDDARAPDFARTVDIHRKPGYDPVELFVDPDLPLVKARIAWRLAQKALGLRYLMDVIPLRPELVKGTHGRPPGRAEAGPLLLCSNRRGARDAMRQTEVRNFLLTQLGVEQA
jgi:predicted AlkP superfamily pyrophosphatase or phosphodiesterase